MKTFKLLSVATLGIFLLSAPAFAAIPNGKADTPLVKQETNGTVFAATSTNAATYTLVKTIREPNGQNDTPLLKQEAHGYLFGQTSPNMATARTNSGSLANVRIGNSADQVTSAGGMGYGGQNNIPLNLQNLS